MITKSYHNVLHISFYILQRRNTGVVLEYLDQILFVDNNVSRDHLNLGQISLTIIIIGVGVGVVGFLIYSAVCMFWVFTINVKITRVVLIMVIDT